MWIKKKLDSLIQNVAFIIHNYRAIITALIGFRRFKGRVGNFGENGESGGI